METTCGQPIRLGRGETIQAALQRLRDGCTKLELEYALSDEDAEQLAHGLKGSSVTELRFLRCKISAQGAKHLAAVLKDFPLRDLHLKLNCIGDSGLEALAGALEGSALERLHTTYNWITPQGVQPVAARLKASKLKSLSLEGSLSMGDQGAKVLAEVLQESSLEDLQVGSCSLTEKGVRYLAESLKGSKLSTLGLSGNKIGDTGLKQVADNLPGSAVTVLFLNSIGICAEGVNALAAVLKDSQLKGFMMYDNPAVDWDQTTLLDGVTDSGINKILLDETECGEKFLEELEDVIKKNHEPCFLLQIQADPSPAGFALTFRTMAGNIAASFDWTNEQALEDLTGAVLRHMRLTEFPLPFRHLRNFHIKIVTPLGAVLDVDPDGVSLAQQLSI